MITYSMNAEADRNHPRDDLGLSHVDTGGGWSIFGPPPVELGAHPTNSTGVDDTSDI